MSYAACVAAIVASIWKWGDQPTVWASIGIAFSGATILNLVLLFLIYVGWRQAWAMFPQLNQLIFPDLNGQWTMNIHWQTAEGSGLVAAKAQIKQDLLRVSMEVFSRDSDSETLIALPKKDPESGRPILYYVYRVIPKHNKAGAGSSYEGSAILRISSVGFDRLSGNYFTNRRGTGHFDLNR
ncbi:Cap15 family cyclic dinucleotide receptor domain-containing protein [Bradyrhizobium sp. 23AC]